MALNTAVDSLVVFGASVTSQCKKDACTKYNESVINLPF